MQRSQTSFFHEFVLGNTELAHLVCHWTSKSLPTDCLDCINSHTGSNVFDVFEKHLLLILGTISMSTLPWHYGSRICDDAYLSLLRFKKQ